MYLYFRQTVHHHNGVNIVFFNKTPEVRLCRRQWHLCDDKLVPSLVALQQYVFEGQSNKNTHIKDSSRIHVNNKLIIITRVDQPNVHIITSVTFMSQM